MPTPTAKRIVDRATPEVKLKAALFEATLGETTLNELRDEYSGSGTDIEKVHQIMGKFVQVEGSEVEHIQAATLYIALLIAGIPKEKILEHASKPL